MSARGSRRTGETPADDEVHRLRERIRELEARPGEQPGLAPAPTGLAASLGPGGTTGDAEPSWEGRPRILVVDDNATNRRIVQIYLERLLVEAAAAGDGRSALDALAEDPFDLVLLDGMMPGMDGPATAREIRRRERMAALPPIPIVALTASVLPEDRRRLLESGMDDHIAKPFQAEDLRRVLGTWLPSTRRTMVIPSPAPPGQGEGTTAETIVDPVTFARLADLGDASFVDRIVRLFLADAAERVAQVDEALEEGDVLRMRRALHALEGICGNVGAVALDRRAREIHDRIGRREDRGEEPLARAFGPTGLEDLLDRTRAWFRESMTDGRGRRA